MTEPTDAEIDVVLCNHWPAFSMQATLVRMWLRDAMRASLDKWGHTAPRGEPVAWLNPLRADQVTTDPDAYGKHGIPLYTAPQPVEREPLSPERVKEIVLDAGYDQCDIPDSERAAFIDGLRHGEEAHGITHNGGSDA